ncbi:MAG: hypothetical protein U0K36_04110 [Bacteroidales bacterium]|nr:hypothetical protein [Bacteroidales bacterium]
MKNRFSLMVALAAACAFSACSDDDDDDDSPIITSSSSFKGTSTASVATFTIPMEDDVVTVAPMEKDKKMAQLTFAAREMPIQMGPAAMNVNMDAFTIDSCIVSGSADNYQLKRKNPFSVSGVKVSVSMIPGESEQTVTGTLSSANLADGVLTVKLDNVKAHENMPMTMSISFEGQLSK